MHEKENRLLAIWHDINVLSTRTMCCLIPLEIPLKSCSSTIKRFIFHFEL